MKTITEATAQTWQTNGTFYWKFRILQSGARHFLEVIKSTNCYSDGSNPEESFMIELCASERRVQVEQTFLESFNDVKEDLYRQMADMVKTAQGLWQPKFQPGDIVMVDKVGSPTVKIIDPTTQIAEQVEKRQVTIEKDECSCSLRTLMQFGCTRKRGESSCEGQ